MTHSSLIEFNHAISEIKNLIESGNTDSEAYLVAFKWMRHTTQELEDQVFKSIYYDGDLINSKPTLKRYFGVTGATFTVIAHNEEEAELKYDAYWNEEPCPCGKPECHCFDFDEDDVSHTMEEMGEVTE